MNNNNYTLESIIKLLLSHKKNILIWCALAFVVTACVSLMMPNRYKAETTFYPASDDLARPEVMFGQTKDRIFHFGGKNERDRLIAVGESTSILDSLLVNYDLYSHFEIDSTAAGHYVKLLMKFRKYFQIGKNELDEIELSFTDENPVFAAEIANNTREYLNSTVSGLIKNNQLNFINTLKYKIKRTRDDLTTLDDSLKVIRNEYSLYNAGRAYQNISNTIINSETKLSSKIAKLKAFEKIGKTRRDSIINLSAEIEGLESQLETLKGFSENDSSNLSIQRVMRIKPRLDNMEMFYNNLRGQLGNDENQIHILQTAYNSKSPALILTERAYVPIKKYSPKRSMLVLGVTIATFIFSILGILFYESYKRFGKGA